LDRMKADQPTKAIALVDPDARFISRLRNNKFTYVDRAGAISDAHTICRALENGLPRSEVIDQYRVADHYVDVPQATLIVDIAVDAYCPARK
jgi:hypothetical protein